MLSAFGVRPKEDQTDWADFVGKANTEKNRQNEEHQNKGNNNDEDVESRVQAQTDSASSHSRVDDEVRSRSPVPPSSTVNSAHLFSRRALFRSMHGDDTDGDISSTPPSVFGSSPEEVKEQPPVQRSIKSMKPPELRFNWTSCSWPATNHTTKTTTNTISPTTNDATTATTTTDAVEYEDMNALKAAAAKKDKEKAATVPAAESAGPSTTKPPGFGFGVEWDPTSASSSDQGFGGSARSSESASSTVPPTFAAGAAKAEEQPKTVPHFTSTKSSGFGSFGSFGNKSATVTAPAAAPSFGTFAPRPAASGFGGFGNSSATVTAPAAATPSFGTFAPRPAASGFGGFGNSSATVTVPAATPAIGGPEIKSATVTALAAATPSFGAFAPRPAVSGFVGFGARRELAALPFGSQGSKDTSSTVPQTGGFSGFGTKSTVAPTVPPKETAFAGFGTFKSTASSPTVASSGFGTFKSTVAPANEKTTVPSKEPSFGTFKSAVADEKPALSPSEKIQMSFGKLNVSGPARVMNALKEKEQMEERQKAEEEEAKKEKKRVHFEDVDELKKAAHAEAIAKEEEEAKRVAAATAAVVVKEEPVEIKQEPVGVVVKEEPPEEDTETDDETEPAHRAMPWGRRPCFRAMLEGGNKKLVLESPPSGVSNYFMDQVYRSYGCTYDSESSTFFATSPGGRGQSNGQVIAMAGNCSTTPVCVTRELLEPAAIAVYEPGLSVCVVTNRGIFVFTRQYDEQGVETGKYLSRQISFKGFHRGIAATAHGGIVSFNNGRIRMFDGTVSNGEERVLAEANYDQIINNALFADNPPRRAEKSNCCFMDIVENRLVMSDLQKHVISLWRIDESLSTPASRTASISFVRAVDVAISVNQTGKGGKISASRIPPGKCCYASGIRLDAEGWVLCADADGRTIQIYDDQLNFVTRVDPPSPEGLPYISGLYIEAGGHLMVCDRKSEMGGLRVYVLESVEKTGGAEVKREVENRKPSFGFAAASKMNHQSGRRF